jgi:hypothetical protein
LAENVHLAFLASPNTFHFPTERIKNCKSRQVGHLKGAKNRKRKCANQNKKVTKTENILQTIKVRFATYLNLIAAKEHS